jgi:hypothetical protein
MVMISIIAIVIFTILLAAMDNISSYNTFSKALYKAMAKTKSIRTHKLYGHLAYWLEDNAWENKYQMLKWLQKTFKLSTAFATYIAKDVLVIFSDGWHAFKFIAIWFILIPHTQIILNCTNIEINFWVANTILGIAQGILFNFVFYRFSNLNKKK